MTVVTCLVQVLQPYFYQVHSYLLSRRSSPPICQYQIILHSDSGICVWTTFSELLHQSGMARSLTHDLSLTSLMCWPFNHYSAVLKGILNTLNTLFHTLVLWQRSVFRALWETAGWLTQVNLDNSSSNGYVCLCEYIFYFKLFNLDTLQ